MMSSSNLVAQEAEKTEPKSEKGKVKIMIVEDENGEKKEFIKEYDFNSKEELHEILKEQNIEIDDAALKTKVINLSENPSDEADHKIMKWIDGSSPDSMKVRMIRFHGDSGAHDFNFEEGDFRFEFKFKEGDSAHSNLRIEELINGDSVKVRMFKEAMHSADEDVELVNSFVFIRRVEEGQKEKEDEGFGSSLRLEKLNNMPVEELSIFPNPTKGAFTTEFNVTEASDVLITVTDTKGAQIYSKELSNFEGRYREQVDLSDVEAGLYFFNLQIGAERETHKIVVQ